MLTNKDTASETHERPNAERQLSRLPIDSARFSFFSPPCRAEALPFGAAYFCGENWLSSFFFCKKRKKQRKKQHELQIDRQQSQ
jgi:hypothetical protein